MIESREEFADKWTAGETEELAEEPEPTTNSSRKSFIWLQALAFILGLGLLIYVINRVGVQPLFDALLRIGFGFFVIVGLSGLRHVLRTVAMRAAVPPEHRRISFRNAFAARLGGEAISFLTFTGPLLGEATKVALLRKRVPLTYGVPALVVDNLLYNLSVVIDDISMGITHVIRGQDHLTNTHKQILLYEALGAPVPQFAHLPLILAPNKGKLSKRKHGEVVSLTTYRDRGFVPAAFRNFLALLGWAPPEGKEVLSKEELVEYFSLEGIGRANAIFNFQENDPRRWTDDKALWMNAEYIRTMPLDELLPMVKAELRANKLWREEYDDDDHEWFRKTVDLIRQRYFTLKDFSEQGRAYFSDDFDFDEAAVNKNLRKEPRLRELLNGLADKMETVEPFNLESIRRAFRVASDARWRRSIRKKELCGAL